MRTLVPSVLIASALLAACSDGTSDSSAGNASDADRAAYVEAIAKASASRADNTFSEEQNRCAAEVYVDVVGLEALQENVELTEIEQRPDTSLADFGLEIDETQGKGIFDGISRCVPDLHGYLATTFAESLRAGIDPNLDPACITDSIDPAVFETLAIREIVRGDDSSGTPPEQAEQLYGGLAACVDLRAAMLQGLAADPQYPAGFADCVSGQLSDEFVRSYWIAGLTGSDKAAAQEELNAAGATCGAEMAGG